MTEAVLYFDPILLTFTNKLAEQTFQLYRNRQLCEGYDFNATVGYAAMWVWGLISLLLAPPASETISEVIKILILTSLAIACHTLSLLYLPQQRYMRIRTWLILALKVQINGISSCLNV